MLAIESLGRSLDLVLDCVQVSDFWRYAVAIFDGSDHASGDRLHVSLCARPRATLPGTRTLERLVGRARGGGARSRTQLRGSSPYGAAQATGSACDLCGQ